VAELDAAQWAAAAGAGILIGLSKTGLAGIGILAIPLMAMAFGARTSVGALLPMLIVGDVLAVAVYRRHAAWPHLVRLLPWVLAGLAAGYAALGRLDEVQMRLVLGSIILAMVGLQAARARMGEWMDRRLPHAWWFAALTGILAGFMTMLANAAGPIMIVYLVANRLPKQAFMGTSAWFYLVVNLIKAPLMVHAGLVTGASLAMNGWMAPAILGGAVAGVLLLPRIPQRVFTGSALGLAGAAAAHLVVSGVRGLAGG